MKQILWDSDKNAAPLKDRGVCFEDVLLALERGDLLDRLVNSNQAKYPGQQILIVKIADYAYIVPYAEAEDYLFLKTIIPSRKATLVKLTKDERDLLRSYNKGEWASTQHLEADRKQSGRYAKAALRKDRRVNIRISENDLLELQRKAVQEGLPYQTLISSILHKYINGRFSERAAESKSGTG